MKRFVVLSVPLALVFFGGCSYDITPSMKQSEIDIASPFEDNTRYSDSLKKLGEMITAYEGDPVKIQSKFILNATSDQNDLPRDISRMLITAINKIGENVIYVPYDPQYILNEAQTGAQISRVLPDIVISGAITEYDKNVLERKKGVNVDLAFGSGKGDTDVGFSQDWQKNNTKISLDLQLLNYSTMTMFPGIQTQNSIIIYKNSKNREFGFSIFGNGLGFNGSIGINQGKHEALRLLVEFSVLELIGKYYNIPYWKLLPNGKIDMDVLQKERVKFRKILKNRKVAIALIQRMLYLHGYKLDINGIYDKKTVDILKKYIKDYKAKIKRPGINEQTYISLYLTLPIRKAAKIVENEKLNGS